MDIKLDFHSYIEKERRHTEVLVEYGESKIFAKVSQYFKDRDNRIIGQKIALARALEDEPIKEVRAQVWDAFYNHSRKTKRLLN